jgi:CheY-like chemotaxis protein
LARKILLADDSVTAQNMGRRILTDAGYEVVTVNNGSAALKKIAEIKPELVVLDVYMPGYSGLEVCQRIKAAPETAGLPILLTVGKLEPFKAEEAKKVFADAFIVKPFEATELLAILSKLEDKIVPTPLPRGTKAAPVAAAKSAPAAKPDVSAEVEAHWKGRLRIAEPEPPKVEQVEQPAPAAFHDIRHEVAAASPSLPESIARNLPGNVTSEELAAITAAVAAFTSRTEEDFESGALTVTEPEQPAAADSDEDKARRQWEEAVRAHEAAFAELDAALLQPAPVQEITVEESSVQEAAAEDLTTGKESTAEISTVEESSAWVEQSVTAESAEPAFEDELPQVQESAELMAIEQEVSSAVEGTSEGLTEFEVNAALASLAPLDAAEDIMSQLQAAELAHDHRIDQFIDAPSASWTEQNATLGTAKWIAQEVGLEQSEAALILEEEMQKVYSALGREPVTIAEGLQSWEQNFPTVEDAESHAPVEAIAPEVAAMTAGIDASISAEETASEGSYQSYDVVAQDPVAEATLVDAVSADEISESEPVALEPEAAAAGVSESQLATEAVSQETVTPIHQESFAAAAAASSSAGPAFADATATAASIEPRTNQGGTEQDAELAAAWARWRQIRESVASPQFVSQVADVATAEIEEAQRHQQEAAAASANGDAPAAAAQPSSDAIASIVDSVLAQLKPKLVEEIAKQLSDRNKQ